MRGQGGSPLPVSAPIHSPLMTYAGKRLGEILNGITINDACIPVVSNVDAQPHSSKAKIKKFLIQHVSNPVRWEESMRTMLSKSIRRFLEIGPGNVLSGLMKWINPDVTLVNIVNMERLKRITA